MSSLCVYLLEMRNIFTRLEPYGLSYARVVFVLILYVFVEMDNYAIVEFDDGLQIIASKWLSEDRKFSFWPSFTSIQRYDRAVEKMEHPEDTWSCFPVLRIMATTSKEFARI